MKSRDECPSISDAFFGSATIGERGQIVIPAEARASLGFQAGDKVVILRHPHHKGLMLCKIEAMREFMDEFSAKLAELEKTEDN